MARKTVDVVIPAEPGNRDSGKTFLITEMAASKAERWANRAILAVANSGANVEYLQGGGMAALAMLGFKALFGIKEGIALELVEEMMQCVQIRTDRNNPSVVRPLNPSEDAEDIEEVKTRWLLRAEVFALHTGFSLAELKSTLISAARSADSANTPMSPEPSAPSSPPAEPPPPS